MVIEGTYETMYDSSRITAAAWPTAVAVGNGWWRLEWAIEYGDDDPPRPPHLNGSYPDVGGISFVIALLPNGKGKLRLEVLSRFEKLHPLEIAFLSLTLQDLQQSVGPLQIEGLSDHPLLHMARRRSE